MHGGGSEGPGAHSNPTSNNSTRADIISTGADIISTRADIIGS
jgi:hypothetical protein